MLSYYCIYIYILILIFLQNFLPTHVGLILDYSLCVLYSYLNMLISSQRDEVKFYLSLSSKIHKCLKLFNNRLVNQEMIIFPFLKEIRADVRCSLCYCFY